jgi:hypothetical protein
MGRQKNNKSLEDLLKQDRSDPDAMDPFEREALEGYDMLSGEEEAFRLKKKLDSRMAKEFAGGRRYGKVIYWTAAAALVLFISFSVYLIRQEAARPPDLALNRPEQIKKPEKVPPEFRQGPVTESQGAIQENETVTDKAGTADIRNKKSEAVIPEETSVAGMDDMPPKSEEVIQAPETGSEQPLQAVSITDKESKKPAKSVQGEGSGDKVSGQTESDMSFSFEAKRSAQNSFENRPEAEPAAAVSAGAVTPYHTNTAVYKGGEEALLKDLKKLLSEKEINRKFDAQLFINSSEKVEQVKLTKTYRMKKNEEAAIKDVLKSLNQFSLSEPVAPGQLTVYSLNYRP